MRHGQTRSQDNANKVTRQYQQSRSWHNPHSKMPHVHMWNEAKLGHQHSREHLPLSSQSLLSTLLQGQLRANMMVGCFHSLSQLQSIVARWDWFFSWWQAKHHINGKACFTPEHETERKDLLPYSPVHLYGRPSSGVVVVDPNRVPSNVQLYLTYSRACD